MAQWLLFSFQCNFVVMQLMLLATIMMESDTKFNQLFLQDFLIIRSSSQNDVMQQKLFLIKQKSTILLHLSAAVDVKFWTGKCYPECQDWSWNQEWLCSTIKIFTTFASLHHRCVFMQIPKELVYYSTWKEMIGLLAWFIRNIKDTDTYFRSGCHSCLKTQL